MQIDIILGIAILIISVILHEVAHGYMANWLGDPTARLQGRLTLNPLSHIDLVGTIILPALLVITRSPILIGYAKPVPYNPYNLSGKYDEALVAGAGPGVNVALALIFAFLIRAGGVAMGEGMLVACAAVVYINMLLALFNLIPIPPLDGSKILSSVLPGAAGRAYAAFRANFERLGVLSGTLLILVVFYFFSPLFGAALQALFRLLTGMTL